MAKELLIDFSRQEIGRPNPMVDKDQDKKIRVGYSILRAAELKGVVNLPVRGEEAGPISKQITAEGVTAHLRTFKSEEEMSGIFMLAKAINSIVDTEGEIISSQSSPSGLVEVKGGTESYFDAFRPVEVDKMEVIS